MKANFFRSTVSTILTITLILMVVVSAAPMEIHTAELGVLELYIAPDGQKNIMSNGKLTSSSGEKSTPVFSLEQVEQIIKVEDEEYRISLSAQKDTGQKAAADGNAMIKKISKVNVHIASGKYVKQQIKWEDMPDDVVINIECEKGAVFEGGGTGTFFEIDGDGSNAVYNISGLNIQNYDDGMILYGISNSVITGSNFCDLNNSGLTISNAALSGTNDIIGGVISDQKTLRVVHDNLISGVTFKNIGNNYGQYDRYGALRLIGACRNQVINCKFINILNTNGNPATLHAIYLASGASNNTISNTGFQNVTGDVIRIRDASHNNTIQSCTFKKAGYTAYCSDWFSRDPVEYQSKGNKFLNNKVQTGEKGYWNRSVFQNIVIYIWGGGTTDIGPANPDRLKESGTVITNIPNI